MVHSLTIKNRKGLAHDVLDTCTTHAVHVHGDVTVNVNDINQPTLPTPFYSVLVSISVCIALSTVFHFLNSPDNFPFSHSVLPPLLVLSTIYLCESLLQP